MKRSGPKARRIDRVTVGVLGEGVLNFNLTKPLVVTPLVTLHLECDVVVVMMCLDCFCVFPTLMSRSKRGLAERSRGS